MESIWMEETEIRKREPLPGDMEAEAVVIGAGLAGILTAYYLKQAGIRTVVLEADRIGSGQTKNTTAKITSQHSLVYGQMIQTFGRRMAEHYAGANEAAIKEYERLIREKGIDCDFARCPAYLYSRTEETLLRQEAEAAKSLGIEASFETDCELPFSVAGVTKFAHQAKFHPLRFLAKMAEEVEVYEQTKVLKAEGRRVETGRGCVTAEHIVFAAHFPFINIPGYYFARMYQERSYVLALSGAPRLEGMYLGVDPGGLSLRRAGQSLLLGGQSHRTGVQKNRPYRALASSAHKLFPQAKIWQKWSAQDCITLDSVPYIGRFSRRNRDWYVATGFGKWGMTLSMVSAHLLTDLICKRTSPYEAMYSPLRFPALSAVPRLASHMTRSAAGLIKGLAPGVMRCPHMGCKLSWNAAEATWDCPCHGSRFDSSGKLMTGPSQTSCRCHKLIP